MDAPAASSHTFRDATRVLSSILSTHEKRVLVWMAKRMPEAVNSDHLTALALLAMFGAGLAFTLARQHPLVGLPLVVLCLAINWFGDSLDGTLARVRHTERPRYGYYVDHVADMFGAVFLFGGLGLSGYMSPPIAIGVLITYLMISAEIYLAAHVLGEFRITYGFMGPTELRILLAIGALTVLVRPYAMVLGHAVLLFDIGGAIAMGAILVILISTSARHARRLFLEETARPSRAKSPLPDGLGRPSSAARV
jgi:archaetidylinositol phosphate synthase